ncbi:WD40-repeat-containing domain protein [Radiomyces spectabilis]|uniref:WD40-repeat-containing domain protein n=1 Tax=Radiomyces spectabilis TaxID=64574 RepID=UPI00221F13B1|nr:WD40-repeat-containing domain protein [Radiomyces spectabilis]KAI8384692.1 WD40-repeat-containing domain protein [Radiomyces spectabilis]
MTLITSSKLLSFLPFSNKSPKSSASTSASALIPPARLAAVAPSPTYVEIILQKDGLPATKCLNPRQSSPCTPKPQRRLSTLKSMRFRRRPSDSTLSNGDKPRYVTGATTDQLQRLPPELIIRILWHLDFVSILNLSRTCHRYYTLCLRTNNHLWRTLCVRDFHTPSTTAGVDPAYYFGLYRNYNELKRRWRKGNASTRYLTGHDNSIYCLVWVGPNLIVSGSRDRSIKMWDLSMGKQGECLLTRTHHQGSVLCLRVSEDRTFMVSGSSDATCLVWSLPDLLPGLRLQGHNGGVLDICIIHDRIISSSRDGIIRVWNKQGIETQRLVGHTGPVNALEAQGNQIVSASGDTTLKLWDIETGQCLRTFEGHTRGLACVRFHGNRIYSGGQDSKLKIWDANTGQCLATLTGHADLIRTVDCFEVKQEEKASFLVSLRSWQALCKTGTNF